MPSPPPHPEEPPPAHAVLRGLPTDDLTRWRLELQATAAATGCLEVLFPPDEAAAAPAPAPAPALSHPNLNPTAGDDGTWQHLARTLQVRSARAIVARFVSGRVWALMLANLAAGSADAAEPSRLLLARPADALRLAREAAAGMGAAPASARQRSRLLFELEHGAAGDYPSEAHHRDAVEWLEVVVHLSVDERAVRLRRAHAFSSEEEEEEEEEERALEVQRLQRRRLRRSRALADLDGDGSSRRVRSKWME